MRSSQLQEEWGGKEPGGGMKSGPEWMEGSDGEAGCQVSPERSCRAQGPQEEVGFFLSAVGSHCTKRLKAKQEVERCSDLH